MLKLPARTRAQKWLFGILTAVALCIVAETTLALARGVPCNRSLLADAQAEMELMRRGSDYVPTPGVVENPAGITCYDDFGGPHAAEILFHALVLMLIGALSACVGPGVDPMRGAIGTFVGLAIFQWVIAGGWEDADTTIVVLCIGYSTIGGVLAFAGGWMTKFAGKRMRSRS